MYYIYEIPGVKIGCTRADQFKVRQRNQLDKGQMIILEEHADIMLVSQREIELQKAKGYRVDGTPYWQTLQKGLRGTQVAKLTTNRNINLDGCSKGGKTSGNNAVASGQLQSITSLGGKASAASPKASYKQKRECPHCGYISSPSGIFLHIKFNHK